MRFGAARWDLFLGTAGLLLLVGVSACSDKSGGSASTDPGDIAEVVEAVPIDHSSELRGPDSDGNGVRDDIDAVIENYGSAEADRVRLENYARALQSAIELESTAEDDAVINLANDIDLTLQCALEWQPDAAPQQIREIEALSINTRERVRAYFENFERRINGLSFPDVANPCG